MSHQHTMTKYRWTICSLIFFATTINYLDRAVISLLKPYLAVAFNWNKMQEVAHYANIQISFSIAYAAGSLFTGQLIDKLGTRIGYALSTGLWSIAAVAHALATGASGLSIVRIFLGVTEAGNFPAAIKATAEWFPKNERALATGIFNSGSNVGAIITPLIVPLIAVRMGWQWAFIFTGAIGFIWLILWFIYYEVPSKQKRLSQLEFDYIYADKEDNDTKSEKVSWLKLLQFKQTWAVALAKFLTDPIWAFYLFWLPDFLIKHYALTGTAIALPVACVYVMSSMGSIVGGYIPMLLINKGWSVLKARKTSLLIYAFCVCPIIFAQFLGSISMWLAVLVIGIAAAAHQAWSANMYSTVSDMFPKSATASVTGIAGMCGAIGGILLPLLLQKRMFIYFESINHIHIGYYIMFFICAAAYLLGWLILHLLAPNMKKVVL
ncbi:MAG: MFS transporter [Phycisphaerales bacterium]|nr:MFS transporter [Phycisphaerales bacterium]